jgi:hypothetical protein
LVVNNILGDTAQAAAKINPAFYAIHYLKLGTFVVYASFSGKVSAANQHAFSHLHSPMTQDQIKDLKGRAEALRRYL